MNPISAFFHMLAGIFSGTGERPVPVVGALITRADYLAALSTVGIEPLSTQDPLDKMVNVCSEAELDRIVPLLVRPADDYIAETADCEDYAMSETVKAAFDYHASTVRVVLGDTDAGYHGFLVMVDDAGHVSIAEPNAGFPHAGRRMAIGEYGYIPRKVFV